MAGFELTASQREALAAFKDFLEGPESVFILKGAAGTGKTTLVKEFLKILRDQKREFGLMAPTGRAAFIIGQRTGCEASTIHKGIYLLGEVKSADGEEDVEDSANLHAHYVLRDNDKARDAVYIVDEASMVSDSKSESEAFSFGSGELLRDLFDFVNGRKIVFVGDFAQLPPVGMAFSPALDAKYLENKYGCKVREVMLREVTRQNADSTMLANATRLRDSIERRSFIEFAVHEGPDTVAENENLLRPYFALSSNRPDPNSAIVAYTNKQALRYNQAVRQHYFGANAPRLQPGDMLMITRNNYAYEAELFNGNIVYVESCAGDDDLTHHRVSLRKGKGDMARDENVDLYFRRVVIKFRSARKVEELHVQLLDNFLSDPEPTLGSVVSRALVVDFKNRLPKEISSKIGVIKRKIAHKEELNEDELVVYTNYMQRLLHDPYYNAVVCKYGYAMTCHKAQGGEWANVFVDMTRIGGAANEDYFRWAYTAITRASRRLWHYRAPEFNYLSNLVVESIKSAPNLKVSISTVTGDFCADRIKRLIGPAAEAGITMTDDRSKPYQHIVTFTNSGGEEARFQLWFKEKGYSGKENMVQTTSEEFAEQCRRLLDSSFAPEGVEFSCPGRPQAEKLVEYMRGIFSELGISVLDITTEAYKDVFHLKTDGLARVGLNYTDRGNYSYMTLESTLGTSDAKLEAFRATFSK